MFAKRNVYSNCVDVQNINPIAKVDDIIQQRMRVEEDHASFFDLIIILKESHKFVILKEIVAACDSPSCAFRGKKVAFR